MPATPYGGMPPTAQPAMPFGPETAPGTATLAPAPTAPPAAPPSDLGGLLTSPAVSSGLGGDLASAGLEPPNMLGDLGPLMASPFRLSDQPIPPNPRDRSLIAPSVSGFKIAENQSPIPQDRIFYSFNYFDNVNEDLNRHFESPLTGIKLYRHVFGLEKTFNNGMGSVGARVPLNTLYADSFEPRLNSGGNSTSFGNLTLFTKYILLLNQRTGSLATVGLALTPPTGPDTLAGAPFIRGINTTYFQPFMGYYFNFDRWFLHGFTAVDVPMNTQNPTMAYNDIGVVYYLYRNREQGGFITAIAPTFEVHVNNPLNHRSEYSLFDPSGTPDIVNLTYGINFEFNRSAVLTWGFVTPVTNPKPFDFETLLLLNIRFGGRRTPLPIIPIIGG